MSKLFLGGHVAEGDVASPYALSASRLRTHAAVVGMTGSGKTGLCVVLLEELVRAGVPIIAIDPKGDLSSLGLLFPELSEGQLAPWVDGDAAAVAQSWREGLARWNLGPQDVSDLAGRLDLRVYTPGSEAGLSVDVLGAFRRSEAAADPDARRSLIAGTVQGLLGLVDRGGDPVRDPASIVLSTILEDAWAKGEDPDLETLLLRLVDPPFEKVGVFPLERFFPADQRVAVAMDLNGLLASPTFAAWSKGNGLDIAAMLSSHDGRTPVHVFNIAHLGDSERHFFLSLLLGRLRAWSQTQPGTEDLRAVLFFDEVAGFVPPHPKAPPTKEPLLLMMKQARAVGLGVVLATQDPVDLDHKALSNAGLWVVGRLRTEQGRDRLLKGLSRPELHTRISELERREFVVIDVRETEAHTIRSRHAMTYLRGPLTRAEIARLAPASDPAPTPSRAPSNTVTTQAEPHTDLLSAPPPAPGEVWFLDPRVALSPAMNRAFEAATERHPSDDVTVWHPALLAEITLRFDEERAGFLLDEHHFRVFFPLDDRLPQAVKVTLRDSDLLRTTPAGRFAQLPEWVDEAGELSAIRKQVVDDIYRTETRGMWIHKALALHGREGESRADFEVRCASAVQERIDAAVAKLSDRYDREAKRIDDRIARTEAKIVELQGTVKSRKAEEVINLGETVWSLFSGRKRRLTTAMSKRRQTVQAEERLSREDKELGALTTEAYDLEERLRTEIAEIENRQKRLLDDIEERAVRLERNDIAVTRFGVLWVPVSRRL